MAHPHAPPGIDPRKLITPQGFHVAPHLMGLPLASPSRRLAAILLDLLFVAIVANLGGKILFAVATAFAFFWFAGRRLGNQGGFFSHSVKLAFRGFGALMLFIGIMAAWSAIKPRLNGVMDDDDDTGQPVAASSVTGAQGRKAAERAGVTTAVRTAIAVGALQGVQDSASAEQAAQRVIGELRKLEVGDPEIRALLTDGMKDRPAAVQAGVRAALPNAETLPAARDSAARDSAGTEDEDESEEGDSAAAAAPVADTVPTIPDSLAAAYVAAVRRGDTLRAGALRPKLASTFARDSIETLRASVGQLQGENAELRAEKKKLEGRGLLATLLEWLDDLGIGFGWTALYFTFFTAMMKGQTPGKKLFGIRVLRLDGGPMTLWASFERYGGYAAGLFTGLTGYMQVWWDRNRQAVQDKISETVVIRDQGQPLPVAPGRPAPTPYPQGPMPPYGGPTSYGQGPQGPPPYPPRPPAGIGTP